MLLPMLLLSSVAIIALAVTCLATTPPGRIEHQVNDKSSAAYSYIYEIEDNPGKGHGKIESRSGEHANGRYYVNSDHSTTDVKYFVDERGYHPFVKYRSADDYSTTGVHFIFGESAAPNLHIDNIDNEKQTPSLRIDEKRKPIQIIQPYVVEKQVTEAPVQSISTDNSNLNSNTSPDLKISEDSHDINYVNLPQQQLFEGISSDGIPVADASTYNIVLPNQDPSTNEIQDVGSGLSGGVPEDILLIQTAGNFGQRLDVSREKSIEPTTNNGTIASILFGDISLSNGARGIRNQYKSDKLSYRSGRNESENQQSSRSNTAEPKFETYFSPTPPDLSEMTYRSYIQEEMANQGPIIVSDSYNTNFTSNQPKKTKKPINYTTSLDESTSVILPSYNNDDVASQKNSTTISSDASTYFLRPIVVADVSERRAKKVVSSTTNFEESLSIAQQQSSLLSDEKLPHENITTSSLVLNPIQAGIALVNADKTYLIDSTSSKKISTPVIERLVEDSQETTVTFDLAPKNHVFGANQNRKEVKGISTTISTDSADNGAVEIQKSIEIYHQNPTQEIHYPPVFQSAHTDQLQQNTDKVNEWNDNPYNQPEDYYKLTNVPDQVHFISQADSSFVQGYSNQNDDPNVAVTKYEQITTDTHHKYEPSSNEQYQYVIAVPQNAETHAADQIYFNELKIAPAQQQQHHPVEKVVEKTVHYPQPYPIEIEKIVEKKILYPVEKIIEKKVPVPQPIPVPIRIPIDRVIEKPVPVPKPIPVTIEKIIEKKVPYTIQKLIPQPYPVHVHIPQPVPVPIPIEKIIEKKVPVPQPYPVEVEKIIERKVPVPVEVTKIVEKPVPVHIRNIPYGIPYTFMNAQEHGLISTHGTSVSPSPFHYTTTAVNHSQPLQGYMFSKPTSNFGEYKASGIVHHHHTKQTLAPAATKKIPVYYIFQPNFLSYSLLNGGTRRRQTVQRFPVNEKHEKDEYIGPVPPQPQQMLISNSQRKGQNQWGIRPKTTTLVTGSPMSVTVSHRKSRQQQDFPHNVGNFRQSKIEYGFKPPMVPSIQYDEETASKVES